MGDLFCLENQDDLILLNLIAILRHPFGYCPFFHCHAEFRYEKVIDHGNLTFMMT
ncbi:hypothetical protein DSCO28_16740 [Desulfosarcina ovata subsp. sediminis]|uniref:Uncharacterized protein n=1 Tax=Desulfosarcina ovata subsp. sediminis TaxID=885957 RepID=A0A5K7ZG09_9BACT|nr:hypothetical protein DSCO28_16740 [Desulfosarcina ovata subsp. sediminis]